MTCRELDTKTTSVQFSLWWRSVLRDVSMQVKVSATILECVIFMTCASKTKVYLHKQDIYFDTLLQLNAKNTVENKQNICSKVGENCKLYKTQLKQVNKATKKSSQYTMPPWAYIYTWHWDLIDKHRCQFTKKLISTYGETQPDSDIKFVNGTFGTMWIR